MGDEPLVSASAASLSGTGPAGSGGPTSGGGGPKRSPDQALAGEAQAGLHGRRRGR